MEPFNTGLLEKHTADQSIAPEDLIYNAETPEYAVKAVFESYSIKNPAYTGAQQRAYYPISGYVLVHKK